MTVSMRWRARQILVVACLGLWLPALGAQQPPEAPASRATGRPAAGRGAPPNPDVMNARQVENYFDNYVLIEARTQLQMTDDVYFKFGPPMERLQRLRRGIEGDRRRILMQLNELSRAVGTTDDAAIAVQLKALDDLRVQSAEQIRQAYAELDALLSPRQRARLRVFENSMEQRKLELVLQAQQRARQAARSRGAAPAPAPAAGARGGGG